VADESRTGREFPVSDDIADALAAPLSTLGLVVVDATVKPAGSRRVLRVLVDRDVSGLSDDTSRVAPLSLDEVAAATRVVSEALDREDLMGERAYTLEVSSPGVGRPLSGYAAFRRNVGRLVSLVLQGEELAENEHERNTPSGDESVTGRVLRVTPAELTVEAAATRRSPATQRTVAMDRVRSGTVQVEFGRAAGDDGSGTEES
jgi:ribosome maturation factor RimP